MEVLTALAKPRDFLDGLGLKGEPLVRSRRGLAWALEQLAGSEAVTLRAADGGLVCIAGLYDHGDGLAEAWFIHGPAMRPCLKTALAMLRRGLEAVGEVTPGVTVVAFIHPESVAGARIAARLGFKDDGAFDTPFGVIPRWTRRF